MKTLHLYHWQGQQIMSSHLPMMGEADALVIYGQLEQADIVNIKNFMLDYAQRWHWLDDKMSAIDDKHAIDSTQWLAMIEQCQNSWAWK